MSFVIFASIKYSEGRLNSITERVHIALIHIDTISYIESFHAQIYLLHSFVVDCDHFLGHLDVAVLVFPEILRRQEERVQGRLVICRFHDCHVLCIAAQEVHADDVLFLVSLFHDNVPE